MLQFIFILFLGLHAVSASPVTHADFILIKDAHSGAVFWQKDADKQLFPSSMTKIMTAYIAFERIKNKQLSLDDKFIISEKAWKTKGSSMFLNVGQTVSVRDLLIGILVSSGNDAALALAEGISGSEAAFVEEMNMKAKDLGCMNTYFSNSSGLPTENHYTTANDLYLMALRTIQDFPEYYKEFYSIPEFRFNIMHAQPNLNPLIGKGMGVDGLKTGHTDAAGYGITISAEQKGMRIILVLNGLESKKARSEESTNLVSWVFARYKTFKVVRKDQKIDVASVWLGAQPEVPLVAKEDAYFSIAKSDIKNLKMEIHMISPVSAPISKDQKIAELVVSGSNVQEDLKIPLYAAHHVETIGFFGRIRTAFQYLLLGHNKG